MLGEVRYFMKDDITYSDQISDLDIFYISGDWEDRKPGYYPFNQSDDNNLVEEDPQGVENRKVLKDPYQKPSGSNDSEPTGIIVRSHTDKITVGPPCYIWFPNELASMVNAHSLLAAKILPRSVDPDHPATRLFLNSSGNPITTIECKHFKEYIGLPITAYDFRRSLATYCLENKDQTIRTAESSVLRHNEYTGFAYYFTKHSNNVELVNVEYAKQHQLIQADKNNIDKYGDTLRDKYSDEEWNLSQRRLDKALEVKRQNLLRRKKKLETVKVKTDKNFILPTEYASFLNGIDEAINQARFQELLGKSGNFSQLLKYLPESKEGGYFPPNKVWSRDFCRILFGLDGPKGDDMRAADLSVYDGIAFSKLTGRFKIEAARVKCKGNFNPYMIVSQYWREKIRDDVRLIKKGNRSQIKFLFNDNDYQYYNKYGAMFDN